MIEQNIAFILGAGSSKEYGFPTSVELSNKIYLNTKGDRILIKKQLITYYQLLNKMGYENQNIIHFLDEFKESGNYSIDEFLEYRKEYVDLGKILIAINIMKAEGESDVFDRSKWYSYLFSKLKCDPNDFNKNKLSILTFNYDRSLEYFLYNALKNSFNLSIEQTSEIIKSFPIIHLHGLIGELYPIYLDGRKYISEITEEEVLKFSKQIKIIHDNFDDDTNFHKAYSILEKAQLVYFLGFGYSYGNLERLKIKQYASKKCFGTTLGLGIQEKNYIHTNYGINTPLPEHYILQFLKDKVPL